MKYFGSGGISFIDPANGVRFLNIDQFWLETVRNDGAVRLRVGIV
jgi:hypothetical protein